MDDGAPPLAEGHADGEREARGETLLVGEREETPVTRVGVGE